MGTTRVQEQYGVTAAIGGFLVPTDFTADGDLLAENLTSAATSGLTRFAADFIAYRVKTQ